MCRKFREGGRFTVFVPAVEREPQGDLAGWEAVLRAMAAYSVMPNSCFIKSIGETLPPPPST